MTEGKPFEVWNGNQLRDLTYVDDAVDALLIAAASEKANGKTMNLGGEPVVSLRDLAELLMKVNRGGRYETKSYPTERKQIDIGDYADFTMTRSNLGWTPKVPLREGLKRTLDYYKTHLTKYI